MLLPKNLNLISRGKADKGTHRLSSLDHRHLSEDFLQFDCGAGRDVAAVDTGSGDPLVPSSLF